MAKHHAAAVSPAAESHNHSQALHDAADYIKQLEARLAIAEAPLAIYKPLVHALSPEFATCTTKYDSVALAKTPQPESKSTLLPAMIAALKSNKVLAGITTLEGTTKKDDELTEKIREVNALVIILLDKLTYNVAAEITDLLAPELIKRGNWEDTNKLIYNKCRDDKNGLPGLYDLVNRVCEGATSDEKFVRVAAVTAAAIMLTEPLVE